VSTLYIFVDESGNLDFTEKGTQYFVLGAVVTLQPLRSSIPLQELKYQLLESGTGGDELQHFHASEDKQAIRDLVFDKISQMNKDIHTHYIIADKRKTHPSYQQRGKFYTLLGGALVKYLLKKWKDSSYKKLVIIFDKLLTKKEQGAFFKELKPKLKELKKPYAIYFHQTLSDFNGQIADYIAWAKYVSLARNELRPLEVISSIDQQEFDIFSSGTREYY
jgi:hypothetical protein